MKNLIITEYIDEMSRILIADMKAKMKIGKRFHSCRGCIKFNEVKRWDVLSVVINIPVIQMEFCVHENQDDNFIDIILWCGYDPDEDDFITLRWWYEEILSWRYLENRAARELDEEETSHDELTF